MCIPVSKFNTISWTSHKMLAWIFKSQFASATANMVWSWALRTRDIWKINSVKKTKWCRAGLELTQTKREHCQNLFSQLAKDRSSFFREVFVTSREHFHLCCWDNWLLLACFGMYSRILTVVSDLFSSTNVLLPHAICTKLPAMTKPQKRRSISRKGIKR